MEKAEFRLDGVLENVSSVVSQKAHDKKSGIPNRPGNRTACR